MKISATTPKDALAIKFVDGYKFTDFTGKYLDDGLTLY